MSKLRHLGAGPDSWPSCVLRLHHMLNRCINVSPSCTLCCQKEDQKGTTTYSRLILDMEKLEMRLQGMLKLLQTL